MRGKRRGSHQANANAPSPCLPQSILSSLIPSLSSPVPFSSLSDYTYVSSHHCSLLAHTTMKEDIIKGKIVLYIMQRCKRPQMRHKLVEHVITRLTTTV